jgi:serine/threonine-protein kinase
MSAVAALQLARYTLFDVIARGGMASVHLARMGGPAGFSRVVAVKRLHPHLAEDREFRTMLLDEARLASRIEHPNVVSILDVAAEKNELFIVMEYVRGASLSELLVALKDDARQISVPIAAAILVGALRGLHAAHEAKGADGTALQIVHRDVSPQNILLGADGRPRITDFGVAKATMRLQSTREGELKGKLSYMAPEQFKKAPIDRRTDIYAAAVVLWELLAGRRLFVGDPAAIVASVVSGEIPAITSLRSGVAASVDSVLAKAMAADPLRRFETAEAMARALEQSTTVATTDEIASWVSERLASRLAVLDARIRAIEAYRGGPSDQTGPSGLMGPDDVEKVVAAATGKFSWDDTAVPIVAVNATERMPPPTNVRLANRSRRLAWSLAALLVTTIGALAVWHAGSRRHSLTPAQGAAADVSASASATVAAAGTSSMTPEAASERATPAASPARSGAPSARPTVRGVTRSRPPKSACDPPFVVDERGVKSFKRECM